MPDTNHLGLLCLMAALSLVGYTAIQVATLFISPVMVSMIRTFEIVMNLVLEVTTQSMGMKEPNQELIDFASKSFAFKVAGCAIVTFRCGHCVNSFIKQCPCTLRT